MNHIKRRFAVICLLIGSVLYAQNLIIPQKKGNLYGLADESGKWVVEPEFTSIEWLDNEYLQVNKTVYSNDSIKIAENQYYKRNQPIRLKGHKYKGSELITPGPYVGFHIIPETAVSTKLYGKAEDVSLNQSQYEIFKGKDPLMFLFDNQGRNVQPEGFSRLEFVDDAGKSDLNPDAPRYILLFVQDFMQKFGMLVFDADKGEIKEWLFKDAWGFSILDGNKATKKYFLSYFDDSEEEQKKTITITDDYFTIADTGDQLPERKPANEMVSGYNRGDLVAADNKDLDKEREVKTPVRYFMKDEILYYEAEKGKSEVMQLPKDLHVIFLNEKMKNQIQNLIYKDGNRYGLILDLKASATTYDSVIYLGSSHYLVCNKNAQSYRCGTLDAEGNPLIPMEYDSILGRPGDYEFIKDANTGKFTLVWKENESGKLNKNRGYTHHSEALPILTAFQNGKVGMINHKNEKILPLKYDVIGVNRVKTTWGGKNDHLVTKEGNLYGMVVNTYDNEAKEVRQEIIEPIFEYYPGFIYRDYYGKKGFHLIGLFDEDGNFVGYASDIGKLYTEQ